MVRGVILPATRTGIAAAIISRPGSRARRSDRSDAGHRRRDAHHQEHRSGRATRSPARSPPAIRSCVRPEAVVSASTSPRSCSSIGLVTNFVAQVIVRRFDPLRARADVSCDARVLAQADRPASPAPDRQQDHGDPRTSQRCSPSPCSASSSCPWRCVLRRRSTWTSYTQPPNIFGWSGRRDLECDHRLCVASSAMATAMALPVGVLIAIYLTEFASRASSPARFSSSRTCSTAFRPSSPASSSTGLLVIGHRQSGYAGAFALAIVMLPLVARAAQETVAARTDRTREAASCARREPVANGARGDPSDHLRGHPHGGSPRRWRERPERPRRSSSPRRSSIPRSRRTSVTPCRTSPVLIFTYSEQPDQALHEQAWGAALVLIGLRARGQSHREGAARPLEAKAGSMTTRRTLRFPVDVGPVEIAQERKAPAPAQREVVFDIRDLAVNYGPTTAVSGVTLEIYRELHHRDDRALRLRKSTFIRCLNRMNDLVPERKIERTGALPRARHLRRRRRPCRGSPADRNGLPAARTRSRSRSTTTSPGARACSG